VSEGQRREVEAGDLLTSGPEPSGPHRSPWIWRIAGVLAVGVLAVTAGPGLFSSHGAAPPKPAASPGPTDPSDPADLSGGSGDLELDPTSPHDNPLLGWTARGPDIGTPFVTAALARMRAEGRHVAHVLWAGSLDGQDHVVVVSYRMAPVQRESDDLEIGALRIDRESQLATASTVTIGYVGRPEDLVGMAWHGTDNHTRLLMLSYPESRPLQISATADYRGNGKITRRWRAAKFNDGVLVTDLGRHVDPTFVVRPMDLSSQTDPILVDVAGLPGPPSARQVDIVGARSPSYAGPARGVLVETLGQAMHSYANLRTADVRVVWSGQIRISSRSSGAYVRGALLVVRRQDGATFQVFVYARPRDRLGVSTVYPVRWSVADQLPYAFAIEGHYLLISPNGPGSVVIRPAVGDSLRAQLDGDGTARVDGPSLNGARVVVRDPVGRILLRSTLVNTISADIFGFGL
jgi:hypothetical protein